jgi:hypothetical protein
MPFADGVRPATVSGACSPGVAVVAAGRRVFALAGVRLRGFGEERGASAVPPLLVDAPAGSCPPLPVSAAAVASLSSAVTGATAAVLGSGALVPAAFDALTSAVLPSLSGTGGVIGVPVVASAVAMTGSAAAGVTGASASAEVGVSVTSPALVVACSSVVSPAPVVTGSSTGSPDFTESDSSNGTVDPP